MALCKNCGTQIEENVKFCPQCGAAAENIGTQQTQPQQNEAAQNDFSAKFASLNNTADTTAEFDANDVTQNKAMAILAYFGPLVLIPIFAAKGSKFARYHSNQGLLLLIACAAWSIVYSIINWVILAISWRLYFLSSIIGIFSIVFIVLAVIGIVNAANGKAKELPVIGKYKILK